MEKESEINMAAQEDEDVPKGKKKMDEEELNEGDDDDFEFSFQFATTLPESPVPAEVAFFEWKIKQLFPVRSAEEIMRVTEMATEEVASNVGRRRRSRGRKPLGELMKVEKELAFPSEAVAVGAYCVWKPPAERESKKTRSWKRLRDLLRRGSS